MAERHWWLHFGLWGCCFWSLILGQETAVQVPENNAVNLPCKAYALQRNIKRIEWKFQKDESTSLFYHNDEFTENYKDRAVFHPNEIHFKSVTRKDNGMYICEVLGDSFSFSQVKLVVQVPPSKPKAVVPSVVTIGSKAILRCLETDGSPPPTFRWFKNNMQVPDDPKTSSMFRNSSYSFDPQTGVLAFEPTNSFDAGDYYCEAANNVGTPQKSDTVRMETSEVNVGGIVAAVVVLLIVLGLVIFGIWFAYKRGFFSKRTNTTNKKVIYSQPSARSDGEFKQTSSFLV